MFKLAPSLLAADFWNLSAQVTQVVEAGAEVLHVDVMDGHFVPNLTMGPDVVAALKQRTRAELDVHLMVTDPADFVAPFADAGADWISFHIEVSGHHHRVLQMIRDRGCKAGLAINPGTPIAQLEALVGDVDFILLMSVNPGFGGQSFIPASYRRLEALRTLIGAIEAGNGKPPFIEVDGGVGPDNVGRLHAAGVDVAVAGSSVFGQSSPAEAVRQILQQAGGRA